MPFAVIYKSSENLAKKCGKKCLYKSNVPSREFCNTVIAKIHVYPFESNCPAFIRRNLLLKKFP